MNVYIQVERRDGIHLVEFVKGGSHHVDLIDDMKINEVFKELVALVESGACWLVISFTGVAHGGSRLLGSIHSVNHRLKQEKGCLAICDLPHHLAEAVAVSRLEQVMVVADTTDDAIKQLSDRMAEQAVDG